MNPVMAQILGGAPDPAPIEIMFDATPDMRQPVSRFTYDDLKSRYDDLRLDHSVVSAAFDDMSAKCTLLMKDQLSHDTKVRSLQERVEELEAIRSADDRVVNADEEIARLNETVRIQRNVIARIQTDVAERAERARKAEMIVKRVNYFASEEYRLQEKHRTKSMRPINQIRDFLAYWWKG